MNKKYKVAAYLRLSQEDGDKDVSDSIVSQKNIIDNKIKELGKDFYIVNYYIDDGYTGLNTDRPAFQRMLTDIEKGIVNCIITKDLSRLSRNSFEANYYIELYFLERNIRYISVLDNVDTGTKNSNNDMIQFKTLINDWYSKDISRKIKSSVWARKEKGMYMASLPPYGYRKSKRDKHKLVICAPEARVIRRIFEEYDKGKTVAEIVKGLQKDKIPSPNNNKNNGEVRYKWRTETVRRMLINQLYLGHTLYGKRINLSYKSKKVKYIPQDEWRIAYNTHEAIIDEELFNRVQNKRNINKTIRRKKYEWELNGLVRCKECGEKMTLKVKYKKANSNEIKSKKIYCLNGIKRHQGKCCIKGSKGISEDDVNEIIYKNLKSVVNKIVNTNKIQEMIRKQNNQNRESGFNNQKELLHKELKKTEDEIKILYSDYKKELLDQEDYKKFYKEMTNQKNRIKKEIETIKRQEKSRPVLSENKLKEIVKEIMNMKGIKKDIISDIIYNVEIDNNNNIYINYKYNIFEGGINERI